MADFHTIKKFSCDIKVAEEITVTLKTSHLLLQIFGLLRQGPLPEILASNEESCSSVAIFLIASSQKSQNHLSPFVDVMECKFGF